MTNRDEIHILVVDDEQVIREGSQRILTKEGWNVTLAERGDRGLELMDKQQFHILLLDLMMPGISGMDVLKKVRESRPELIVIVVTGYATIENAVEAMKNGAYDFIPKPFTPDQVRIVVRRAIEKISLQREAQRLRGEQERSLRDIANEKSKTLTIMNHMADGVLVTDEQGSIVLNNPAVTHMLGLEEKSPLGKSISQWTHNEVLSNMVAAVLKMDPSSNHGISQECALGDPPKTFLMAHAAPVCTGQQEIIGSVTIFNDITWLKELDQMKSDFVNMVSHELRSPLSAVRQKLSLITEGITGEITDEQSRILTRVQSRIDGLIGMTRNLLDLSRIEAGRLIQQKEKVCVSELIDEALESLAHEADKRGITFDATIDSQLYPLYADRQNLETVVINLLSNAIKYNRDQGAVSVSAHNRGEFIELNVRDTGVGIAQKDLPHIFDKFFRIRSESTRDVIGSGIGLPLVKAVVEAHLGTISVDSSPGKGTAFTVLLPRGM